MSGSQGGFFRVESGVLRNISELYSKPGSSIKGQFNALATDTRQVWVFVDDRCTTLEMDSSKKLGVVPHTHISPTISVESSGISDVGANTGATSPGTVAHVAGIRPDWSNPSNATASNDSYATCTFTSQTYSDPLDADNFSFSIPTDATITGIKVTIERK